MPKIIIRDGTEPNEGNCLSFDLAQVLAALGPHAISSSWSYRDLWFVSHDDQEVPELEQDSEAMRLISGHDLMAATDRILQVIDGEFAAFDDDQNKPWVIVRAVDSSLWEVESSDANVLAVVRECFRSVEDNPEPSQA